MRLILVAALMIYSLWGPLWTAYRNYQYKNGGDTRG